MLVRRRWVAIAAVGMLGACSDAQSPVPVTGVAPPPPVIPVASGAADTGIVLRLDGPQDVSGVAGETLDDFPRVRVVRPPNGTRVPGVTVTFYRVSTGDTTFAVTDASGVAHFGRFTFGKEPGIEQVFAVAGSQSGMAFSFRIRAPLVDRYDLLDIAGRPLPIGYSGGGQSWLVTGGHYLLRSDGTFDFYYDGMPNSSGIPVKPTGRYERSENAIDFYLYPPYGSFYQLRNGHFSRGTIAGGTMTVTYEDSFDFETERYVIGTP